MIRFFEKKILGSIKSITSLRVKVHRHWGDVFQIMRVSEVMLERFLAWTAPAVVLREVKRDKRCIRT